MVTIFNVVPGPVGAPPALILQNNGMLQQNGGQIGVQVFWIPGGAIPPAAQQHAVWYRELVSCVYAVALNSLTALKTAFNDVNASSDMLRLVININKFCEEKSPVRNLPIFAHAFSAATGINNPRSLFNRFYSVFSGEAANKEPFDHCKDWPRVASKILFLISDAYSSIDWLHEIGFLTDQCVMKIGKFCFCDLSVINTAAVVTSSAISALDNFRLVLKYAAFRDDTLAGERTFKLITASFDIVSDICRIASSILFAISSPQAKIAGIVISAFGNVVSILKFSIDQYTQAGRSAEKAEVDARKAAALQLIRRELQIAARALHHARVARQAMQLVDQEMQRLGQHPGTIQLQTEHALAMQTLGNAIALMPHVPAAHRQLRQLQRAWNHLQQPVPPVG